MNRVAQITGHVLPQAGSSGAEEQPSPIVSALKSKISALASRQLALKARLLRSGDTKVQELSAEMVIQGARNIKALVTDTSDLDPARGITYRGLSLADCNRLLPKAAASAAACGLPEAALWLLLTGEVPSPAQCAELTAELHRRSDLPPAVFRALAALPREMHSMTQLSICVLVLQSGSKFAAKYAAGMPKAQYWEPALEDALDLVARIPVLAVLIYHKKFRDPAGTSFPRYDSALDWAGNFAQMLEVSDSEDFREAMRLYLMVHADHEGGNVSAHTAHLVGSALSDPYLAWAAGICGLSGPLHGLANQECLAWLRELQHFLAGRPPSCQLVEEFAEMTMRSGRVVPGFGHAVLRQPDPRYLLEREFALEHCREDPLFQLVDACYRFIPPFLERGGKVKNPYPNVDAHSGQLMSFYGLREEGFYTAVFAVSRTVGVMAQYVWARALGLPIERPKSVPLEALEKLVFKKS